MPLSHHQECLVLSEALQMMRFLAVAHIFGDSILLKNTSFSPLHRPLKNNAGARVQVMVSLLVHDIKIFTLRVFRAVSSFCQRMRMITQESVTKEMRQVLVDNVLHISFCKQNPEHVEAYIR